MPKPNMTTLEACGKLSKTFMDGVKDCKKKTGSEACSCWTNETLKMTFDDLKKCNYSVGKSLSKLEKESLFLQAEQNAIKTAFKKCKSAFGSCRKYEDDVLKSVVSCSKVLDIWFLDLEKL